LETKHKKKEFSHTIPNFEEAAAHPQAAMEQVLALAPPKAKQAVRGYDTHSGKKLLPW